MVSKPRKRLAAPLRAPVRRAQRGADGARLARNRDARTTSASGTLPRMKSTCAFTTAMLRCVPPWSTNLRPDGSQILQLAGVDPDVDRQHRGQRGHDLLGRPALALLVDDVGLEEDAAAHGQGRHGLRLERAVGIVLERDRVALGHALEEGAVAGRALGIQPEVGDRALAQDHDLDVGAAHVADHVGVGEEVQRRRGMRHRLHHRRRRRRARP